MHITSHHRLPSRHPLGLLAVLVPAGPRRDHCDLAVIDLYSILLRMNVDLLMHN